MVESDFCSFCVFVCEEIFDDTWKMFFYKLYIYRVCVLDGLCGSEVLGS